MRIRDVLQHFAQNPFATQLAAPANAQSDVFATEQTGDFTLTAAMNGKIVIVNKATAVNVTVPADADAGKLPAQFACRLWQKGAGQFTVAGNGFAVKKAAPTAKSLGASALVTVVKLPGANTVSVNGELAAS